MRDRLRLLDAVDFHSSAANVTAPALVITGDAELDYVVPVKDTLRYQRLLPRVEVVHMRGTGHHGTITRPEDFARHLDAFAARVSASTGRSAGRGRTMTTTDRAARNRAVRQAASRRCSSGRSWPKANQCAPSVVFAHPHPLYGGTMHTKGVYRATKALAALGCAVLRFNFRGVGRSEGMFDNGVGELEDFRAALDAMAHLYPDSDAWAAGFSFGAWVALTAGALDDRVTRLIAIAPALHMYDFTALRASEKPNTSSRARSTRSARSPTSRRSMRSCCHQSGSRSCRARIISSTARSSR